MSAKKKMSQSELRKFMNEHKSKQKEAKKIESPLAKYNDQSQLTCVLCKSIVRSDAVWTVHINTNLHKQNVEIAKKLKERTNNFTTPLKRPLTPPRDVPEKKIKGILKKNYQHRTKTNISVRNKDLLDEHLPGDTKPAQNTITVNARKKDYDESDKMETNDNLDNKDILPEGFFDDPKLDAKARNQEYKDPVEEEWEKFIKAIREADSESSAIIAEDQEEATTERQIVEIDEQLKKLSRVLDLEKKKVEIISISGQEKNPNIHLDEDEVDDNFDEFLNWRVKQSFK